MKRKKKPARREKIKIKINRQNKTQWHPLRRIPR
jgi:hypothetical protein